NPRTAIAEMVAAATAGRRVGVMFGPERTGLTNDDLVLANAVVSVPLNPQFTSLNVAQAALFIAHEWGMVHAAMPDQGHNTPETRAATGEELVGMFEQLEAALDEANFWRVPEKKPGMVRNIRAMFQRAQLTEQEVRTLRGIVKSLAEHRISRRRRPK